MAKRKVSDTAQMNLRLKESLRKKVEIEAKRNGVSLNQELVRRLERSFVDQGVEALIQTAATAVATEVFKQQRGLIDDLLGEFNHINRVLGRPELTMKLKGGENDGK